LAALLLAACARKNIDNQDAVRAAVMEYLTTRQAQTGLDLKTMDIEITEMRFQQDEAHATAVFKIKGTDAGMSLPYTLDRKGDKWVVRPRQESDNPHGNALPSGAPVEALPPGHPGVGSKQ
jgi:hypothetical protein